ncbi:MAG: 4-hydroxy-tetrahydrodipicolinate synthase [Bacteroidetes bacterium]|nr:4-hydroxy-tetrahydrodipicolinate synthase [Bacteroidota bacterium]MBS1650308.1 4-hydroxy-tetrahydrodipicolinate synthase [Bacteroidota bacterium]
MSLINKFFGTGVALITPFKKDYSVDYEALGRVIDHVINGGVEYVVTLGTTGETPTLTKAEKLEIVNYTYTKVNNRVPVVVGIGGNNTAELLEDFKKFPLEKATAILSASPYYSKPSQEGLYQHYKTLADAAPKPIVLYNVPGRTGRNMSAALTTKLSAHPNIVAMKEASGDMQQCMEILRDKAENFTVVSGDDALGLSQMACGMKGVISVAANAYPKEFSELVRLCLKNDFADATKIHYKLLQAYDYMFVENNPAGVKAFMYEMGLIENVLRLPVTPVSNDLQQKIKAYVKAF